MNQLTNKDAGEHLLQIAQLMQLDGAGHFRTNSYRRAANWLLQTSGRMDRDSLLATPGFGKSLVDTVMEFFIRGTTEKFETLSQDWDPDILTLTKVRGIGLKKAQELYEEWGIRDFDELVQAAENGELPDKLKREVLIAKQVEKEGRMLLKYAQMVSFYVDRQLREHMQDLLEVWTFTGSLRREKETCKDIDVVAAVKEGVEFATVIERWSEMVKAQGDEVLTKGKQRGSTRWTVYSTRTMQIDLWAVTKQQYGAAVLYATGSKDFNIVMRQRAIERGMKLNEFGLWQGDKLIASEHEGDIFQALGVKYVVPKERETA